MIPLEAFLKAPMAATIYPPGKPPQPALVLAVSRSTGHATIEWFDPAVPDPNTGLPTHHTDTDVPMAEAVIVPGQNGATGFVDTGPAVCWSPRP
jgi:hypothetical protein